METSKLRKIIKYNILKYINTNKLYKVVKQSKNKDLTKFFLNLLSGQFDYNIPQIVILKVFDKSSFRNYSRNLKSWIKIFCKFCKKKVDLTTWNYFLSNNIQNKVWDTTQFTCKICFIHNRIQIQIN